MTTKTKKNPASVQWFKGKKAAHWRAGRKVRRTTTKTKNKNKNKADHAKAGLGRPADVYDHTQSKVPIPVPLMVVKRLMV